MCDADVNECETDGICLNDGACVNDIGSFGCECMSDFSGPLCQFENNACVTRAETCDVAGTGMCENLDPERFPEPFECICKPGYSGSRCEFSACDLSNPCLNDGDCSLDSSGGSICSCQSNDTGIWTGTNCDIFEPNQDLSKTLGSVIYF